VRTITQSGLAAIATAALSSGQTLLPDAVGPSPVEKDSGLVRFAVIGDYGYNTIDEAQVAALVNSFRGSFVITTGDNNYPAGDASTIDLHIGQYYSRWIGNYSGGYGPGAPVNRFFPSLGNHDWVAPGAAPYLAYFTLPGNERYYDFVRGPVHFYAVDSDGAEPDGNTATSVQAQWLQARLAAATEPFQVVYFHHPPYSSAAHGSTLATQWPFRAWGADLVLSGHDHDYERIVRAGFPYIVNGLGGAPKYGFGAAVGGSALRYNATYGAMVVEADADVMRLDFVSQSGFVQDRFTLPKNPVSPPTTTWVASGSAWRYRDNGVDPAANWTQISFNDSSWPTGNAQLGYGDGDEATVVSYGPNANLKYVTTWFRRAFQVTDPSVMVDLTFELVCDDGAVAYLNGVEIARQNIVAGAITSSTLATDAIGGTAESAFATYAVPTSLIVTGTNVLAVEVHQQAQTSSDISFDARLLSQVVGTRLLPAGSAWKFRDTGVAPPATWTQTTFDDSSWPSGLAQLGYGEGDEATVVSYGPNSNQKYITTWFRRTFTVTGTPAYQALLLRLLRDDGAVVYLNGEEVFRQNLPLLGLTAASTTELAVAGVDETTFFETYVDARLLHGGTNVIAVEVHQNTAASPDLSFDLELLGL
jgi:hypothetical protein